MFKSIAIFLLFFIPFSVSFKAQGQLVAGFTVSDTAGCAPIVVHFTNTSTGATSYSWNLGNGTTSTLTDVSGSYLTAGTYTITLVAHNGTSSSTYSTTIRVYGLPTVSFHASDTTICPGTSVTFTSTSIPNCWGGLTYNWNFGDGSTSTATSPAYTYSSSGNYNVTLFATNAKGCINSLSKDPYVTVFLPPSPGFTASGTYLCTAPAVASFSNSTIGVAPLTYFWRFGDGGTSALTNPPHTYSAPGSYDVLLRATDVNGCKDSVSFPGYITVGSLSAAFTPISNACINASVTFFNTSSTHLSSAWNFGDGDTAITDDGTHTYTATGTYTVRLVVYDGTCYDTITHSITINHPTGSFSISPAQPCPPPRAMTFNATVAPGSTVRWYSLDYGSLGTGTTITHTYPIRLDMGGDPIGTIDSITMVVTDVHGCADTVGKVDTINVLRLDIMEVLIDGCSPVVAHFDPTIYSYVYDPFAGSPWYRFGYPPPPEISYPYPYGISSYLWNFGDGSPTSTSPLPVHTYTVVGGVYTVSYSVVTANGCTASVTMPEKVKVGAQPPTPSFTRHPSHVCAGQPVYFTPSATGVFDTYGWDYGDGNSDTGIAPVHIFTAPGIFTMDLKTFYNGCPSTHYVLRDTVDSPSAVIHYSFDCVPRNEVTFNDYSLGDNTHLWQFGDGTTSTAYNPVHTFPADTTYTVTLTTYNIASGCRDTMRSQIQLEQLRASLYASSPAICRDIKDSFSVFVTELPTDSSWVTKYRWFCNGVFTDSLFTLYPADTISHAFHTTGTNTVMAVLTDNHGCFDTLISNVLVAKPVDSFNFAPTTGCAPLAVLFTDHSTPTTGTSIARYFWTFGDAYSATTFSPTVTHVYSLNGTYNVREIVTDSIGCADTLISHTHPVVHRPTAAFTTTTTTVCARRSVSFTNTSTSITSSLWFFGDGDTSSVTSPTHAYNVSGSYTVKLVVVGTTGCTDTLIKTNYITVKPLPVPSFTMSDSFAVCSPFSVTFTNTSTGATSYFWTFGDGTSSSSTNPSDVYIRPGYYRVKLLAINSFSCTDTAVHHVNLFGYSGAFTYAPTSGCAPLPVHFLGTFSSVAHVIWDFSDGVTSSPSTSDTITHTYLSSGAYVPKLILTDSFGCTNFSIGADTIKIGNLAVGFTTTPSPVCQGNVITFHDTTSGLISPIVSWLWTFAPGYTSTSSAPIYTYTLSGTYPVTLSVANALGCSGSITRSVVINAPPSPITGASSVCIGTTTTLTDTSTGGVWSSASPTIASVGSLSGVVTGVAIGTTTISYSLGSGCVVIKLITVNAAPSAITGSPTVCVGATITLTDSVPGGRWASALTGVATVGSLTGIVLGVSPGIDTILYTVGGCTVRKSITVNPLSSAISGPANICIGKTGTFTVAPTGGTWSSGSPGIASVGTSSGIVMGISAGTAVITYTLPSGCFTTATVIINGPPSPIAGGSFVCIGGSITLTDIVSGGVWSSSNTAVALVGSGTGVVTGVSTGTASISYNVGGCIESKTVSVNTLPPSIVGPDHVCATSTITLYDSATGGAWSSSNLLVATVGTFTGMVTGVAPGTATISYSLGGGCVVTTTITVNSLPAAITGSPDICVGTTTAFTDPTPGGTWSSSNPVVAPVSTGGLVTGLSGGVATIDYTMPNSCAATYSISVNSVPPITGIVNMCAFGDTIFIHDADTTGSYSSTSVTVTNIGGGSGKVIANAPGLATITYTLPGGCSITVTLTVNPLPGPISGAMSVCLGSATTLHDASPAGLWSTLGTGVVTVGSSSGVVSGVSVGAAHITYTLPTGCKTDTLVTVVTFPVVDSILGPSAVCVGQAITLTDSATGGVWTSANSRAIVAGGVVTGVSAGSDIISYSVINACGAVTATKSISIYPAVSGGVIVGANSVCVGSSITLTDTTAGGVWSSSNAFASVSSVGVVTGNAQGVDTIGYTVSNPACSSRAVHVVTVNPLPDAGNISGASDICLGDSTLLTETASGGVWSQFNSIVTLVPVSGGIKCRSLATGIDTVYYSVTNVCGTAVAKHPLTVSSLSGVGVIQGLSAVCAGDSTTLTDTTAGGLWTSSNLGIVTIGSASGVVKGLNCGKDTITYTISNACGTATTTKQISVDPIPVAGNIIGDTMLCVGDSVTLNDSVAGGVWSIGNGSAIIKGAVMVTGVSAGTDVLSYTVTNNCGSATATRQLTIEELPDNLVISRNDKVLSVDAGYASYQWTLNGKPISGATNSSYTFSGPGTYSIIVHNSFGCSATCPDIVITDCTPADIHVYPNPAKSVVYIQWCSKINARLSCMDGKLINVVENATEVDVSYLPNGMYSLTLFDTAGNKLLTKRITKLSGK